MTRLLAGIALVVALWCALGAPEPCQSLDPQQPPYGRVEGSHEGWANPEVCARGAWMMRAKAEGGQG